ncbi:hypothetical protein J6I90_06200 [Pseudidiomarina sp. 1APP75-32.1]|uniref:GspL cytoplasmic actin-ATPase-like domain-containing protein n=1 Tax=Pseudidiomarina terrestris TaxID=2820060 RepID=A0AAW7QYE1_9GAMM|nr:MULTISPECIES: hypothetical protein [unclassified Pseudidiomarina]MDN7124467.1 hypothetical protein [Pseudidiomarina sp. 1APP75-32.1]MDN7129242.1 hypothetical protein [Pseudidiomarina sp. 1APR75-15]
MAAATSTNTKLTLRHKLYGSTAALVWRVNQQGQWFQGESAKPSPPPKRRVACLVLARSFYQESWQSFTIRSFSGLRKVLKQKAANSSQQHFIGPWQDGQRRVLTLTLSDEGQSLLSRAFVVLPESLVLSAALTEGFYQIESGEHCYFLFNQEQQWQTAVRSSMMRDAQRAQLALGSPSSNSVTAINDAQLGPLITRGVSKLGSHYWRQGWQKSASNTTFAWQPTLAVIAAIGGIYLALSSGYLMLERSWLNHKLEAITPEVSELLTRQNELASVSESIAQLSQVYVNADTINGFWEVFAVIEQHQVSLSFMQGDGKQLSVGGQTESALELLKTLHALPQVEKAEFATPVRGGSGQQRFRIDLSLLQQGGGQ